MFRFVTIIILLFFSTSILAQKEGVKILLEINGKPEYDSTLSVKYILNQDTLFGIREGEMWLIPDKVFNKRATVIFNLINQVLYFDSIPITLNSLNPSWLIGYDTKPFDKEKFYMIDNWKDVNIVYFLKNADGRVFTVHK